jgi:catalase
VHVPRPVEGIKVRERGPDDEYAQATMFWHSMTEVEQDHIVDAFTFELGKCDVTAVVERMLERLTLIDADLARRVGVGLGIPVEAADGPADDAEESPSLSMVTDEAFPVDGRVVHILANDGADLAGIGRLREAFVAAGAAPHVIATHKGAIAGSGRAEAGGLKELTVDRSFHTASSAEADAIVVADGAALADDPIARSYVESAYRHHKTLAAWGDGVELLNRGGAGVEEDGVVTAEQSTDSFAAEIIAELAKHRHWERVATHPTRLLTGESA